MLTLFLFRLSSRATRSGWMTIQTQTLMTTWGIMPMRCERGCWSFFAQCLHLYFSGRWQFWGLLIVIEFRHRWCRPWVWIPPQLWTQVCNDNLDYSVDGLIHLVSISEILVSQFCPVLHFWSQQVQETCRHVRPGVRLRRVWGLFVHIIKPPTRTKLQWLNPFKMISRHQEGPDFDNPSFYPKPQQQQQPSAGVNFHLLTFFWSEFFRSPRKWKLVLALGKWESATKATLHGDAV